MRILVISDVHANMTALDAVLEHAGDIDSVYCLGDCVGYGADPNECVERLQALPNLTCIMGNHDAAALGLIDIESFNKEARQSSRWRQRTLTAAHLAFLGDLPESAVLDSITLAHGSPRNPLWEYILDMRVAIANFASFDSQVCFIGHSHLPLAFLMDESEKMVSWKMLSDENEVEIEGRAIINPGSVGQPRDHDPRAAYGIYDTETRVWQAHRVSYDIADVQKRIRAANLPKRHADRLADGW